MLYRLEDRGHEWAATRDGKVFSTWPRDQNPERPGQWGILNQMAESVVAPRLGGPVRWVKDGTGYRFERAS